jgi:hypothetical protein
MITLNETLLTFEEAAEICRTTWKTIYVWSKRAAKPLESIKLGGKRMTSKEAIERFMERDGEGQGGIVLPPGPSTDYEDAMRGLRERHGAT